MMIKLGVLGVSNHFVKRVFFSLRESSLVEVYAIASRNPEKAKRFAEKYNIKKWYGSYEELLADKDIDAVYIPLPNHLHLEYIKKSADNGKHILCEKPLTLSAKDTIEAVNYANSKSVLLMEAFMYKFHPQWIKTKELIERREIGEVQTIHCYFSYNHPDPTNFRNNPEYGGGVLFDIGVYATSTARYLLQKEPERVSALLEVGPFGVDSLVSGMLYFGKARSLFTVAGLAYPWQRVEIFGSGGLIFVDIPFNTYPDVPVKVSVTTTIGKRDIYFGPDDHYLLEFEFFANAIMKGESLSDLNEDSIGNAKVIDALFAAAKKGKWVRL